MKLTILIDDPETRAIWETAQRARAEVAGWPAWKRGEQTENPAAENPSDRSGADRDGDGSQ